MAASVYATPPPDLSGEDTVLSDISSTSAQVVHSTNAVPTTTSTVSTTTALQTANCKSNKQPDDESSAALASVTLVNNHSPNSIAHNSCNSSSSTSSKEESATNTTINGINGSLVDQFEAPDLSKKRRKQTMPIRISNSNPGGSLEAGEIMKSSEKEDDLMDSEDEDGQRLTEIERLHKVIEKESDAEKIKLLEANLLLRQKLENSDDGMDLVQKAALLFSHLQKSHKPKKSASDSENENNFASFMVETELKPPKCEGRLDENQNEEEKSKSRSPFDGNNFSMLMHEFNYHNDCGECGMKFDSEFKVRLHMLQEHGQLTNNKMHHFRNHLDKDDKRDEDLMDNERMGSNLLMAQLQQHQMGGGKPEDWLSLPGLPFPFPPEAAAALSAGGYLPQLPLLGMPSQMPPFPTGGSSNGNLDSLSRQNGPPLRIFNPEAYCDLCNKEFCNKYFLKTHRANKHGIYESTSSGDNTNSLQSNSNPSQNPAPPQQASNNNGIMANPQTSPQQLTTSSPSVNVANPPVSDTSVHCDICFKKFTNLFTMRRHRTKVHDAPASSGQQQLQPSVDKSSSDQHQKSDSHNPDTDRLTPIRFPEGFRQDFSVEQEDANFTPQPRKLSPMSSQQARDSNFSVDKLKRLGVLNPEAFCEICCKEYCNKYFLRTHKLKRHGILMPPEEIKETMSDRNPWQYVQTSPLNLIMGGHPDFGQMQQHLHQKFMSEMQDIANRSQMNKSPLNLGQKNQVDDAKTDEEEEVAKDEEMNKNPEENEAQSLDSCNKPTDTDAISMDLQKLQSMILQLNDLNANQQRPISCNLCGKELGNQYLLHAHMISEHGHMPENLLNLKNLSRSSSPLPPNSSQFSQLQQKLLGNIQTEFCKQCDKEFATAAEFKQHLTEMHETPEIRAESISPTREGFVTPDRPTGGSSGSAGNPMPTTPSAERRPPYTMTPTSSYCEICNKELCNKYFMKTHMQRMHGIEIENGSQIGGVVCNICNKELCSKYFLRVHKHNTHGIVEEGSPLPPAARPNGDAAAALEISSNDSIFPPLDLPMKPTDLADLSSRYFSHFTEVCPLCTRRFRSAKWLKAHLMSDHGKAGVEKLKELEQRMNLSKSNQSPTLKIPNGSGFGFNNSGSPEPNLLKNNLSSLLGNSSSSDQDEMNNNSNRMKEYQCSFCPFSTPYYAFLFIHERSHSLMNPNGPGSAHLHANSPILSPNNPLLNEPMSMKENLKNLQLHNAFSNQSELAVSIAKDLYPGNSHLNQQPPMATSASTSEIVTPNSTPASTPGIIVSAADSKQVLDIDLCDEEQKEEDLSNRRRSKANQLRSDAFLNRLPGVDVIPMAKLSRMESSNMLKDMANLTKRPAIYALPKDSEPMIMQSFLIEEAKSRGQKRKAAEMIDFGHDFLDLRQGGEMAAFTGNHLHHPLHYQQQHHPHEGKSSRKRSDGAQNRFVPAVVFLPVRERISTPVTISFTLTPA